MNPLQIVAIMVLGPMAMIVIVTAINARAKTKSIQPERGLGSVELERRLERLEESLELGARIEERLANLETIVLEQEREQRFDRAL